MSGVLAASLGGAPEVHECSRAGCRSSAEWAILWRNPKIHAPERRKTWLACAEHLTYLREFLAARSFPLEVVPVTELETTGNARETSHEHGTEPGDTHNTGADHEHRTGTGKAPVTR